MATRRRRRQHGGGDGDGNTTTRSNDNGDEITRTIVSISIAPTRARTRERKRDQEADAGGVSYSLDLVRSSPILPIHKATGTKRISTSTRPVPRDASVDQTAIKIPHGGKIPGCTTSCGLRCGEKQKPQQQRCQGRSQTSIMPISNDSHRSEAIEDCIEFINSSSSFTRSNSTS
ncbi:hypothetical protein HA466_0283850 [Hirschfeldia incana]|nr:hypothetical protein HA466_0283850 [Hirschfeldia incana]